MTQTVVTSDVTIIGAGIMGAAAAYFLTAAGLSVSVIDRGLPASGTSSHCEGNILISDKELGPELELTRYSLSLWKGELAEYSSLWEFEAKGGLIVASKESSLASLQRFSSIQIGDNIRVEHLDRDQLIDVEPHLSPAVQGGAFYPDDSQVQPILAAIHLLRIACTRGARFFPHCPVTSFATEDSKITGVNTPHQRFRSPVVLNATGPWAGEIAKLAGVDLPVAARRGFVMVSQRSPWPVFHKVYAAEYVDNVGSSHAGLQGSPVVESTPAGTILIGSSRERVGFDHTINTAVLAMMARNAIGLFPFLEKLPIIRHYHGFRPYSPDHLPIIGPDLRAPGLWHATGHEGAGIGLSAATGALLAQAIAGKETAVSLAPFRPERFEEAGSPAETPPSPHTTTAATPRNNGTSTALGDSKPSAPPHNSEESVE